MSLSFKYPSEYEYILPMDDKFIDPFVNGPMIKSVEYRSNCIVEISKKVLNRRLSTTSWTKFNIITIKGPNETSVDICNKLLERLHPNYIYRRPHDSSILPTIYTTEFCPDNSNLVFDSQRSGANIDRFKGLSLYNRHRNQTRYPKYAGNDGTPWKNFADHFKGMHYPCQKKTHVTFSYLQPNTILKEKSILQRFNHSKPEKPKVEKPKVENQMKINNLSAKSIIKPNLKKEKILKTNTEPINKKKQLNRPKTI